MKRILTLFILALALVGCKKDNFKSNVAVHLTKQ